MIKKIILTGLLIFSDLIFFIVGVGILSSSHTIKNSMRLFWSNFVVIWVIISVGLLFLIWWPRSTKSE
jgi:hypothetical protein